MEGGESRSLLGRVSILQTELQAKGSRRSALHTHHEAELCPLAIRDIRLKSKATLHIAPCEVAAGTVAQEVDRVQVIRLPEAQTLLDTIEAIDASLQTCLAQLEGQGGGFVELLILDDLMLSVPDERAIPVR